MPRFELRTGPDGLTRKARFASDVNPADEAACVALLRKVARQHGVPIERAVLRTWVGRHRHQVDYRAG